jgi:hypothetical protein
VTDQLAIHDREAAHYFRKLEAFLGSQDVERRISQQIERSLRVEKGVYREYWLRPRSRWWLGFASALRMIAQGRTLRGGLTAEMKESLDTAVKIVRLYPSMPSDTRLSFKRRILTSDDLRPVLLEIDIAALFATDGYEITWLEGSVSPGQRVAEFIATGKGRSIEVECKAEGIDSGRKLTRPSLYRTVDAIAPKLLESEIRGRIDIVVPDRIPKDATWRQAIAATVEAMPLSNGAQSTAPDGTVITLSETYEDERRSHIERALFEAQKRIDPFEHVCLIGRAEPPLIVNPIEIHFRSRNPDAIVRAILDDLRDAKGQLSGAHPGLICTYLPEVDDFEQLKSNSALSNMTLQFFNEHAPEWVYGVSYSSDALPIQYSDGSGSFAPALGFRNPHFVTSNTGLDRAG